MKKYQVYRNNNVECYEVAAFDTLGEAKRFCAENTKSYPEVGDSDNCYESRSNNFCYQVYEGEPIVLDENGDADLKEPVFCTNRFYCD